MSELKPQDLGPDFVCIKNLSFQRQQSLIFNDISLTIPEGKTTAIMGVSGTGKTTLLRLISGQLLPLSGQVIVDGSDIASLSRQQLYDARKRMGFLFQGGALFTNANVFDNVAFPLREHTSLSEEMIRDLVLLKLEAVGLRGAAFLRIDQLSGGMARRAALARAIAMDPRLMMYDEPFTGQDPITRGILSSLIKKLNNSLGLTSIVVSHNIEEVSSVADWVYLIYKGQVLVSGTPDAILKDKTPAVNQFVRGLPDGPVAFKYPGKSIQEELIG